MIDLVMLKDFLVLCRIKSFSRAAQECHVSVSGLSRRIQTLEQWLGAPVFERHKHALELTEAGRQLQGVAQDAVRALDNLRQSIRERDEDAQRRIRFCAPHILSSVFFPHWIPRLQADFRSAKFSVDCDYLPQCLSRLRDGSVDYVVALLDEGEAVSRRLGIDSEAEFQRLELGHEQLVAVCAPDAAGQPLFNLDRLQTEALSFLATPRNATWAGPWNRCCATAACSSSAITAPARPRGCASSPSRVWASPGCRIPWSARTSPAVAWCAPAASASTCRCATP